MKKIIRIFSFIAILSSVFFSCKKDETMAIVKEGSFSSSTGLTASSSSIVLSSSTDSNTVVKFTWPTVSYGAKIEVNYILQIDTPSDTTGTSAWGNAQTVSMDTAVTKSYLGTDLNTLCNTMGLTNGSANTLVLRVKAYVSELNGTVSAVTPVYSNVLAITVTPYKVQINYPLLYVPGAYQNWAPATAPTLAYGSTYYSSGFEGYVYMASAGEYKFTSAPDWSHVSYGIGSSNGTLSTTGGNMTMASAGYYRFRADTIALTYSYTQITSWSVVGSNNGWSATTTANDMTYDATNEVWQATVTFASGDTFKFLANHDSNWAINFGATSGVLKYGGDNITVSSAGTYLVKLDLHVPGNYTYSLTKQ